MGGMRHGRSKTRFARICTLLLALFLWFERVLKNCYVLARNGPGRLHAELSILINGPRHSSAAL